MKISNYFSLNEAIRSSTATKLGIKNNYTEEQLDNIRYAAARMDLVRQYLGRPLMVSSWFRNEKLNSAVGGVSNSDHKKGLAIDFYPASGMTFTEAYNKLKSSNLSFKQLIIYPKKGFVHIAFCRDYEDEKREVLVSNK